MRLRDVLADAALLAPGRAVLVLSAKGEVYVPPLPPAPPVVEPDPLAEQLTRVELSSVAARAALLKTAEVLNGVAQTVQQVVDGQQAVLAGLENVERVVAAPTESVPVYDRTGKIIGARHVKQKG